MYDGAAIECARSALPQFVNAQQSAPAHTSSFSYGFPVPYSCPAGSRFEDGRTNMMVTCSDYGWAWPAIVISCACEAVLCKTLFVVFLYVYSKLETPVHCVINETNV